MSGVYTIPPTSSFVDALANYLLCETKSAPETLANYTVLLPNRRGIKALQNAFLRLTNGAPLMLPLIRAIADVTEEELVLLGTAPDIAPPIKSVRRQIILAQFLIKKYPDLYTLPQALMTAAELGRFLDSVHTEGLSLDNLDTLVTGEYAQHWEISLDFLRTILRDLWPALLQAEGVIDPALNRRLMIEAYTQNLIDHPPQNPIIAAGSTGSIPVTANLLRTIAHLPNGTVILPGLDTLLDAPSWDLIEEGHPQSVMKNLLSHIGITRDDVHTLPHTQIHLPRAQFISEIMRPPACVGAWVNNTTLTADATQNIHLLEAETLDNEATAIALMMREHAQFNLNQTMLLITPDRLLANRVTLMLRRWGIQIDDSAGTPLSQTDAGSYLLLLAQTLAQDMAPVPLLGLLKHDLSAGGGNIPNWRNFVRKLEQKVLRGIRPASLLARAKEKLGDDMRPDIETLTQIFDTAKDADDKLTAFITLAQTLATAPDADGSDRLWSGESGDAAAKYFGTLLEQSDVIPTNLSWSDLYDLLLATMPAITVRPRYGTHPRLAILGAMEARLYQSDIMILGSLNENTWPPAATVDGWLSRPMRTRYGLPSPERAITLSAHDFCQGLGAPTVYLTRSKLRDGTPTTPSRWLQRMDAVIRAANLPSIQNTTPYLHWASRLDMPTDPNLTPATRPSANPPIHARPKTLSVTDIVNLQKDPYGIYAKYTLNLRPWNPLDAEPGPAERGTLIHSVLEQFNREYPRELPENALDKLITIGRDIFNKAGDHPDILGHWWPRFERMASAFIQYENDWRTNTKEIFTEIKSTLIMNVEGHEISLTGRADRIEYRLGGNWAIIDYKSGNPPSAKMVESGVEPQLTLLGAMLQNNAFNDALKLQPSTHSIESLAYWPVSGNKNQLKPTLITTNADAACQQALDNLITLLTTYMQGAPYHSWPDANTKRPDYYPYTHFERVLEWHTDTESDDTQDEAA